METTQSKLNITCPNCEEENIINLSSEIKCKKCEKNLTKWKYSKLKKKFLGTGMAFILIAPAYEIGKHMYNEDRYPIAIEYSIVQSCISSYDQPLQRVYIKNKKTICVCALSKTMKEIDYDDYTKNEKKFLDIFEQKTSECP